MSRKRLTILFTPLDGWGHINACHGIAETLRGRGHRVVFAIDIAFKGKLTQYGFEEEIHCLGKPEDNEGRDVWGEFVNSMAEVFKQSPIEITEQFDVPSSKMMIEDLKARDSQYKDIINRVKPDLIIIDAYFGSPTLTNSGIPYVWLYSAAPQSCITNERIPPAFSGLPLNGNKNEWKIFEQRSINAFTEIIREVNEWRKSCGVSELPFGKWFPESPHLNLYMYPKELDYEELQPLPHNWKRVDGFVRTTKDTFTLPEKLQNRSGKLVFLSMGSFGCANLELMTRLVRILAKSEHRFIVSKGPLHDKYELADNMWGQRFVSQTALLPSVDLVVTHGGNNTVTETFFFGKPMLVMPLFGDQFDNAQRISEVGLGLRLNPFHCSEEELLKSVNDLVNDKGLAERMTSIGERIRNNNDKNEVSDLIENIIKS